MFPMFTSMASDHHNCNISELWSNATQNNNLNDQALGFYPISKFSKCPYFLSDQILKLPDEIT